MTEQSRKSLKALAWLGWLLLLFGLMMLLRQHFFLVWQWGLMALALVFFYNAAFRQERQNIFPGLILFLTAGAMILRHWGVVDFEIWKFWCLLIASLGIAFIALWVVKESGIWVFFPGGLLLVAGGGGLAEISWWRYQRFLREIVDQWVLLTIVFALMLLIDFWRHRADRSGAEDEPLALEQPPPLE